MECCATHLLLSECSALRAAPVKWTHPECAGPGVGPGVGPPFQTPVTILKPGAVKIKFCQISTKFGRKGVSFVFFPFPRQFVPSNGRYAVVIQSYLPPSSYDLPS